MQKPDHTVHYSSKSQSWVTPDDLFAKLHRIYQFDLDVAATEDNSRCERFCQKGGGGKSLGDGLATSWADSRVWINPPYGREIGLWVDKANKEAGHAHLIVMLVPSRTDTEWWHRGIRLARPVFLKGRLKFKGAESSAPFPSALLIWNA